MSDSPLTCSPCMFSTRLARISDGPSPQPVPVPRHRGKVALFLLISLLPVTPHLLRLQRCGGLAKALLWAKHGLYVRFIYGEALRRFDIS